MNISKALQERLDSVRESHERQPGLPYYMLKHNSDTVMLLINAELTWLEGFIKKLETMSKETNTNNNESDLEENINERKTTGRN